MNDEKEMPMDVVDDNEQIARVIFSPSMINGGEVAPSAYNLLKNKYGIREHIIRVGCENCYISEINVAELYYGA